MNFPEELQQTHEIEILRKLDEVYEKIEKEQVAWKEAGGPRCIDGCGCCCHNFEPHIYESEALYLASFIIMNKSEIVESLVDGSYIPPDGLEPDGTLPKTCIFFKEDTPYHCTVYQGRCLICRLFGYSGDFDKNHQVRFTACKFYPREKLQEQGLEHRQYTQKEILDKFGTLPGTMADIMQQAISITPDDSGETEPIRTAVPKALRKLLWLMQLKSSDN